MGGDVGRPQDFKKFPELCANMFGTYQVGTASKLSPMELVWSPVLKRCEFNSTGWWFWTRNTCIAPKSEETVINPTVACKQEDLNAGRISTGLPCSSLKAEGSSA